MCELLALSSNNPVDICFSFRGFAKRGGEIGPHKDGWGVTFYEDAGYRTFKDHHPCSTSPIAKIIAEYPIKSKTIIAHIRKANRGNVSLVNTHPFTRVLWNRYWTFAHNGQLKGYKKLNLGNQNPVGQTDSEYAFCYILNKLEARYKRKPKNWIAVFKFIKKCADELRALGIFNLLLTDGRYLFTYCTNNLHYVTRAAPFGVAKLVDDDYKIDFDKSNHSSDVITVIATKPLTSNETWHKYNCGEAYLFLDGKIIF